ncbi:hypothetical protein Tco_1501530 [Tanacetum coccineum]
MPDTSTTFIQRITSRSAGMRISTATFGKFVVPKEMRDKVDSVELTSPDDDASEVGSGANMFIKGLLSTGANGFSSTRVEYHLATPMDESLEIVKPKMTVNDLEKEQRNLVFQHEEVPGIHQTLVGIKSPVLYLWGVHKVLQEPNLVRALNLSV